MYSFAIIVHAALELSDCFIFKLFRNFKNGVFCRGNQTLPPRLETI